MPEGFVVFLWSWGSQCRLILGGGGGLRKDRAVQEDPSSSESAWEPWIPGDFGRVVYFLPDVSPFIVLTAYWVPSGVVGHAPNPQRNRGVC